MSKEPTDPEDNDSSWDLTQLVAALRDARGDQPEGDTRSRERPSRDAMLEILRDLRAVLFPTHFGGSNLRDASLDFFVGSKLDGALRALMEQARRSLRYATHHEAQAQALQHARELVTAFSEQLPRVRTLLETDLRAAYEGDPAASSRSEILLCYPGVSALIHHRIAHELYRLQVPLLPRIIAEQAHAVTGIDIHPGAQIGERFFIDHGTGVVIGETAIIGARVRLYQGVTLGARRFAVDGTGALVKGQPRHPIIEDDVVIYAGATVLGRITIGSRSTIGGNTWVTQSVAPDSHISQAKIRHEDTYEGGGGI